MLLAWMLLATIGIFVPRYMKETFKNKKICQVHAWFAVSIRCNFYFLFNRPHDIFITALCKNSSFWSSFFFKFTSKHFFKEKSPHYFNKCWKWTCYRDNVLLSHWYYVHTIITTRSSHLQVLYRKALSKKTLIFHRKIYAMETCFSKVTGVRLKISAIGNVFL